MEGPLHCPNCGALIVDRRFANCTTCHAELPAGWVLTPEQISNLAELDQHARAEYAAASEALASANDPNSLTEINDDSVS